MPSSSSSSSSHTHLSSPPLTQLKLSWMLRAPQPFEEAYWGSQEVQLSLARLDKCGLLMSVAGMLSMLAVLLARGVYQSNLFVFIFSFLMAATMLQLVMAVRQPALHKVWRHHLAWANRLGRIVLMLVPMRTHFDVTGRMLPTHHHAHMAAALLGSMCLLPITQFYGSLCFVLPAASALLVQVPATVVLARIASNSHATLSMLPGMQQFADDVCAHARGIFELALHVLVDQAAMPAVPAAGFDAFGTRSPCGGKDTFAQLLLFANLNFGCFLPVFFTYLVELRHKLNFWATRHVSCCVQASPLLPVPSRYIFSHCCVLLCAQLVLWFVAELLVPLLV